MVHMKDYNLTCGEVIDNLLTLADAYEKASAGKSPNGFAFNPTDAAANMKAAVAFIGIFGQQLPRWIPVEERLPEERVKVLTCGDDPVEGPFILIGHREPASIFGPEHWHLPCFSEFGPVTHWQPLPSPPDEST